MIAAEPRPEGQRTRYLAVRAHTEKSSAPRSARGPMCPVHAGRGPAKWHRAHTHGSFEQFCLGPARTGLRPFDADFSYLFIPITMPVGSRHPRPQRGLLTQAERRPSALSRLRGSAWRISCQVADETARTIAALGRAARTAAQELLVTDHAARLRANPLSPPVPGPEDDPEARPLAQWKDSRRRAMIGAGGGFCFVTKRRATGCCWHPYRLGHAWCATKTTSLHEDGGYASRPSWMSEGFASRSRNIGSRRFIGGKPKAIGTSSAPAAGEAELAAPVRHVSWMRRMPSRLGRAPVPTEAELEAGCAHIADSRTLAMDNSPTSPIPASPPSGGDRRITTASSMSIRCVPPCARP